MRAHPTIFRRQLIAAIAMLGITCAAHGSGGSYATTGTGTYSQSLWWLDFSGYSNSTAAGGGQAFGFTLPNGVGTLSTTLKFNGNGTLTATGTPAWSGGGAIGHGAYNGISGAPDFYWLGQIGTGTLSLNSLVVKDAAGNARTFSFFAADGENTNNTESILYTSTAGWKLLDTLNTYASYNGGVPALTGLGTTGVTETVPVSQDNNDNASVILGTQNPTQASVALSGNEAAMFAIALPTVSLTINIAGRVNGADQFTASIGYTNPAGALKNVNTSATATSATTSGISVIGTNSITLSASMLAGSASPLGYYNGSIACTNSGPGASAYIGTNTVLPAGSGASFALTPQAGDNIACTLNLTPVPQTVTGTLYNDVNHDSILDNGETGTSLASLYVKLSPYSGAVCQTPAIAAAAVSAGSGAYSVSGIAPGTYCAILTNSSALSNTTPYQTAGYVGTEGSNGIKIFGIGGITPPAQNFGLYYGSQLSLVVFADTGSAAGTANDGVQNGGETGVSNVVISAVAAGTAIATSSTAANGTAIIWMPGASAGASVTVTPTAPNGDLPTGGTTGTTGGTYSRPSIQFVLATGNAYGGVSFGLVPPNSFTPNGSATVKPGGIVFYPHTFVAGTAAQVSFSTSHTASPAIAGWSEAIYLDSACSGQFNTADTVIKAPIAVTAATTVCVIVKEFAPANAPANASNNVTITATANDTGSAAPAVGTLNQADITTISASGTVSLTKQVLNATLGDTYATSDTALPGQLLQYLITVANQGSDALSNVVVNDATPAFTSFVAASCPPSASLPAGLTACAVAAQPTTGNTGGIQWVFSGTLPAGGQTAVSFQVRVTP